MAEGISSVTSMIYSEVLNATTDESSKTTEEILNELQQSSTTSLTAKDIVDDYGVSYSEARKILEQLEESQSNSRLTTMTTQETENTTEEIPEDSTVAYRV